MLQENCSYKVIGLLRIQRKMCFLWNETWFKLTCSLLRINTYSSISDNCSGCRIDLEFFCYKLYTGCEWGIFRDRNSIKIMISLRKSLRSERKFRVWSISYLKRDLLYNFLLSWFLFLLLLSLVLSLLSKKK